MGIEDSVQEEFRLVRFRSDYGEQLVLNDGIQEMISQPGANVEEFIDAAARKHERVAKRINFRNHVEGKLLAIAIPNQNDQIMSDA